MQTTIQILAPSKRRSFKEGKYVLHECQCIVLGEEVLVGVLKISEKVAEQLLEEIPDGQGGKTKTIKPGAYELDYGLGIAWDSKELVGQLKEIRYVGQGNEMLHKLAQMPD